MTQTIFEDTTQFKKVITSSTQTLKRSINQTNWNTQWTFNIEFSKFIRKLSTANIQMDMKAAHRIHSSAIVYFRRYYMNEDITKTKKDPRLIAATAVFFSSKVEGIQIPTRLLVEKATKIMEFPFYQRDIIETERDLTTKLKESWIVWHPLKEYELIKQQFNFPSFLEENLITILNDSYLTNVILMYRPNEITLGCIVTAGILQNCDIRSIICSSQVDLNNVYAVANEMLEYYMFVNSKQYKDECKKVIVKYKFVEGHEL